MNKYLPLIINLFSLFFILTYTHRIILGNDGIKGYYKNIEKIIELKKIVKQTNNEIDELEKEKDNLENDEFFLEKIARERLGLMKKGEIIYRIIDKNEEEDKRIFVEEMKEKSVKINKSLKAKSKEKEKNNKNDSLIAKEDTTKNEQNKNIQVKEVQKSIKNDIKDKKSENNNKATKDESKKEKIKEKDNKNKVEDKNKSNKDTKKLQQDKKINKDSKKENKTDKKVENIKKTKDVKKN